MCQQTKAVSNKRLKNSEELQGRVIIICGLVPSEDCINITCSHLKCKCKPLINALTHSERDCSELKGHLNIPIINI